MRTIDANAFWKAMTTRFDSYADLGEISDVLDSMPTISPDKARSRWNLATYSGKYGTANQKWYDAFLDGAFWYCDNCKERARRSNYCPNCGAKMEVSDDADD